MTENVCSFDSPLGTLILNSDGIALTGLAFDEPEKPLPGPGTDPVFRRAAAWLEAYFAGQLPDPADLPPLAPSGTPFQLAVWELLRRIPFGGTVSYGEIARELETIRGGRVAAQAVGQAVGANPIAILIPCHRVIGADGKLTGYGGGLERKQRLLALEAHAVRSKKETSR